VVAYVASRLITKAESSFIFDFSAGGHRSMGGTVSEACINVYDFSENCQLTGHMTGGAFQLFHHGDRVHVSLEIFGQSFRGYDQNAGRHFSGVVSEPRVSLKDDADLRRYAYWCESPQCTRLPDLEVEARESESDSQAREAEPENPVVK
jgi:hypothetical protein